MKDFSIQIQLVILTALIDDFKSFQIFNLRQVNKLLKNAVDEFFIDREKGGNALRFLMMKWLERNIINEHTQSGCIYRPGRLQKVLNMQINKLFFANQRYFKQRSANKIRLKSIAWGSFYTTPRDIFPKDDYIDDILNSNFLSEDLRLWCLKWLIHNYASPELQTALNVLIRMKLNLDKVFQIVNLATGMQILTSNETIQSCTNKIREALHFQPKVYHATFTVFKIALLVKTSMALSPVTCYEKFLAIAIREFTISCERNQCHQEILHVYRPYFESEDCLNDIVGLPCSSKCNRDNFFKIVKPIPDNK
jgi:hypothetical protein